MVKSASSSVPPCDSFWMCSVEPDATGTMLTFAWDASTLMKMLDAVFVHSDKDVEGALANFKREVEALA